MFQEKTRHAAALSFSGLLPSAIGRESRSKHSICQADVFTTVALGPRESLPGDNEDQVPYFFIYFLRAADRLGNFLAHQLAIPLPHPEDSRS